MTREQAVRIIRRYLCDRRRQFPRRKKDWMIREEAYLLFLSRRLINDICESEEDPIKVVQRLYLMLDDTLSRSDDDHFITHNECSRMLNIVGGMLRCLHNEERRKHEP